MASVSVRCIETRAGPTRKRRRVLTLSSDEELPSVDEGHTPDTIFDDGLSQQATSWSCPHCMQHFEVPFEGFSEVHSKLCEAEQMDAAELGVPSEGEGTAEGGSSGGGEVEEGGSSGGKEGEEDGSSGGEEGEEDGSSGGEEGEEGESQQETEQAGPSKCEQGGSSETEDDSDPCPSETYIETSEDEQGRPKRFKGLTADETVIDGLRTGQGPKLQISSSESAGRGVVAGEKIYKGQLVCEYKTSEVYDPKKRAAAEERHRKNALGCYIIETKYAVPGFGQLCFDATERFHHPGRYINHVAKGPNVRLTRPFDVRGKVRIGFLALRDIPEGEELCYDYGDRSGGEWMRKGRLVEGRVVAGVTETSEEAVVAPKNKKKKPFRNSYYCPLPECYEKGPMEKIANHMHQFHGLKGVEARRVLKLKKLATKAQVRDHFRKKRAETGSGDIRAMLGGQQAPVEGGVKETDRSVARGKGKGKGKAGCAFTWKAKGKAARKGEGKAGGDETGKAEGKLGGDSGTRALGRHTGPFLEEFQTFLTSRAGGKKSKKTAKGIVANVAKFLFWCDPLILDDSYLSRAKRVREYIEGLEGKVGPSGLQQHISDIEAALRFAVYETEGTPEEGTFSARAESTFRKLKDFRASFRGEKAKRERAKLEDLAENLPTTADVCDFLQSSTVTNVFEQCCSALLKNPSAVTYNKALTICAGRLLYRNAQRPGAVSNMTLQEYDRGLLHGEGDSQVLMVRVANHKTGMTERASVSCSGELMEQLKTWVASRRALIPESSLVFPKWDGTGPIVDLTARVRALGERMELKLPTAQKLRSIVEIKATPLDSAKKSLVARALSHTDQTAEQHYRAAQPSKRAEGYEVVGQLVGLPAPPIVDPIPSARKRQKFTEEQAAIIRDAFSEEIRTERPPSKATSEIFLQKNGEVFKGKSAKDVYDKVRNEYRNKK